MRKLFKLNTDNEMILDNELKSYLDPEFIYLPIDETLKLKENEKILKNQIILNNFNYIISTSISGLSKRITDININNQNFKAILIQNDFKEKNIIRKTVFKNNLFDLLALIKFDVLYNKLKRQQIENIIINGIEDEPYTYSENFILKMNIDIILTTLETLNGYYNNKNNLIVLNNKENENINNYLENIGTYPELNIVVLDDLYLIGKDVFLLEKLNLQKEDTIILKPSEILEISNYLKWGINKSEKYITLIDMINKRIMVINTKKWILIKDLLIKFDMYSADLSYIKNGLMTGININPEKEIIDDSFNSITILKHTDCLESDCLNCGKCYFVCPIKINPRKSKDLNIPNNNCFDCGLCSYYCPANINLRKYLKGDDNNE